MRSGWQTIPLGEVCNVIGGGTPSKDKAHSAFYSGDIRWATVRDMKTDLISDTEFRITEEAVKGSSTNIIPKGNVVIATRVGLGKVCLVEYDTAINQDLRGIVPKEAGKLAVPFLFWWLKSTAPLIIKEGTGATVQGVKLPFIKSLQIPTPPFPEQQRIVAVLDEAFAGIATAIDNAELNLSNARELFESTLQSVFTNRQMIERQLGELASFRNGINFTKASKGDTVKILGVKDFQNHFSATLNDLDTVTTKGTLPDSDMLKTNDILFVRSNGNLELIGRCLLVGEVSERVTFSGFTIRARLNDGSLNARYLCHFLKAKTTRQKMIDGGNGVNIKSLNQTTLSTLAVPFPTYAEQTCIAIMLDELSAETKKLEAIYQQKLKALDELKKSILHQAFSGQL